MEYSELAKRKIQLYFAANYLYDLGLSHPQVVERLTALEDDTDLVVSIADEAMKDEWRKVHVQVQKMISEGSNFEEALKKANSIQPDPEIAYFLTRSWHEVQSFYVNNLVESSTNITEGIEGVVICSLGLAMMFWIGVSLVVQIFTMIILAGCLLSWLYGLQQKKKAKILKRILEEDYTNFEKII